METPIDIYCWVGKSATPDLYRKGLHSTIALDEAVSKLRILFREQAHRFPGNQKYINCQNVHKTGALFHARIYYVYLPARNSQLEFPAASVRKNQQKRVFIADVLSLPPSLPSSPLPDACYADCFKTPAYRPHYPLPLPSPL